MSAEMIEELRAHVDALAAADRVLATYQDLGEDAGLRQTLRLLATLYARLAAAAAEASAGYATIATEDDLAAWYLPPDAPPRA